MGKDIKLMTITLTVMVNKEGIWHVTDICGSRDAEVMADIYQNALDKVLEDAAREASKALIAQFKKREVH